MAPPRRPAPQNSSRRPGLDHASYTEIAETLSRYDGWAAHGNPRATAKQCRWIDDTLRWPNAPPKSGTPTTTIASTACMTKTPATNGVLFAQPEQWPALAKEGHELLKRSDLEPITRTHLRRTLRNYDASLASPNHRGNDAGREASARQPLTLRLRPALHARAVRRVPPPHRTAPAQGERNRSSGLPRRPAHATFSATAGSSSDAPTSASNCGPLSRQCSTDIDNGPGIRKTSGAALPEQEDRSRQPPDQSTSQGMGR